MGLNDKATDITDKASGATSNVRESTAKKLASIKEAVSNKKPDSEDIVDLKDTAKRRAYLQLQFDMVSLRHPIHSHRVMWQKHRNGEISYISHYNSEELEELIQETKEQADNNGLPVQQAKYYAHVPYEKFSNKDVHLKSNIKSTGGKMVDLSQEVNWSSCYEFGTSGYIAGKKYGHRLPKIGAFAPYLGFGAGFLGGAVISAYEREEDISKVAESASEAASAIEHDEDGTWRNKLVRGGVGLADAHFSQSTEPTLEEALEMDYQEFSEDQ